MAVTDAVCLEHLDIEYGRWHSLVNQYFGELCRKVVGKLGRKRPSPLVRGDLRIWASTPDRVTRMRFTATSTTVSPRC